MHTTAGTDIAARLAALRSLADQLIDLSGDLLRTGKDLPAMYRLGAAAMALHDLAAEPAPAPQRVQAVWDQVMAALQKLTAGDLAAPERDRFWK
jgi:hypothetical protein